MKTTDYDKHRDDIRNGDLILFRGEHLLGRIIRHFDGAWYNHIGLVLENNGRYQILDSNAPGVEPEFLSKRMQKYTNYAVLRPSKWTTDQINAAVTEAFTRSETHISYDFTLLLEIAVQRKAGLHIHLGNVNRDICSEFVYRYMQYLQPAMVCYTRVPTDYITPWDYVIYNDPAEFTLIGDESGPEREQLRKV